MSDVMLIGILRMPLNLVFPSEPDAVMAFQIHARMGEAADRIEADEKKITRLLAVEVAAKEISDDLIRPHHRDIESDVMLYSCERCSVLHNSSVDFPHGPNCELLVINPIGDKQ